MERIIGKYKIYDSENQLKIRYIYTFSDFIGSLWFLITFVLGALMIYTTTTTSNFQFDASKSWVVFIVGLVLSSYGLFMILSALYNPINGVFEIDKIKRIIIIRDLLKNEKINADTVSSVTYKIVESRKPKVIYSTLQIKLKDGSFSDCFIIRTSHAVDVGRKIEKDLHLISREIRDVILNTFNSLKPEKTR